MLGWKVAPGREVNQLKNACVRASKSWDAISHYIDLMMLEGAT